MTRKVTNPFDPYIRHREVARKLFRGSLVAMQVGLMLTEGAIPAIAVWRLRTHTGNHIGFDLLWAAIALAVLLAVVSIVRISIVCRWRLSVAAWFTTLLSLLFIGYVDQCGFLMGYEAWIYRRMPSPNPACCAVLRFARTCQSRPDADSAGDGRR